MLASAHQGYIYQDILGAYFVAQEIAQGRDSTKFHFDYKKTPKGVPDKFDDLVIYQENKSIYIQVKYSNDEHQHALSKQDFSSSGSYDLALFDLFETWKALNKPGCFWRVCLAWDQPEANDPILDVLNPTFIHESFLPGTTCYQFNCDSLWPKNDKVLSSWKALKKWSKSVDRTLFKAFLDSLVVEVGLPKSTLLQDYSQGIEKHLAHLIDVIGVGIYPNDHLTIRDAAERICNIVRTCRATENSAPISCDRIAQEVGVILSYGGIEQQFPIDEATLVKTPDRITQVVDALEEHRTVILTAEPGAGKSWFIENLEEYLKDNVEVVKHYCYTALEDPLSIKRITVNTLYGSLITQIIQSDSELRSFKVRRYASNLEELNLLLKEIKKKTLLIVDGIDHIWRVYQKNRGGITENETTILEALAKLNHSNSNVLILIVSQPIEQLNKFIPFYSCILNPIPEVFVKELLEKNDLPNYEIDEVPLSHIIHGKSNGNTLYCRYLIDHVLINKIYNSFDWITSLPAYEFNLTGYYQYLYEQIQGDTRIPYALCGADFSLTEEELRLITHLGENVLTQLSQLKPILNYKAAYGYSIYHESFKRFVVDKIRNTGASIEFLIYRPLIEWLETHHFFESTKAYGHLLRLYYETDSQNKIANTIEVDFIDKSLYNAQPFHTIHQNHRLQKESLQHVKEFAPMIVIAEQSKIVNELENLSGDALIKYLKAVQKIQGDELMYRVLWDGEHLLINKSEALQFLVHQAYEGENVIHWSIVNFPSGVPYEMLGLIAIKLLHKKQYEKFDQLVKDVNESSNHFHALEIIISQTEWWTIYFGEDWILSTPYFYDILTSYKPSVLTIEEAIENIISNDRFIHDDNWLGMLRDLTSLTKIATQADIEAVVLRLSLYNWFRNWLIYLIKITELSNREYRKEELIDAFTYLVRDLEPFKGTPRVSDLYKQLDFIKKSFHIGLKLCDDNDELLITCCELLERVTEVTTGIFGTVSGPLPSEEYLELIAKYLSKDYVQTKYEEYYTPLGSRRVYSNVAEISFEYARILSICGKTEEARVKYREGVQALTAYGYRKDRTLSEILYCSVPYQQAYGTLNVEWFYELYHLAMTVVTHTDGKSTRSYPTEWFKEFIKVYPDDALKFLVSETLENSQAEWHQEEELNHIIEEHPSLFTPTQWFLLCKSLPLASSNKIIHQGLTFLNQIDLKLRETYHKWLQSLPKVHRNDELLTYSSNVVAQFQEKFGISLKAEVEGKEQTYPLETQIQTEFPTVSLKNTLAFLEDNVLIESHVIGLQNLVNSTNEWTEIKLLLRQAARSFKYQRDIGYWVENIFEFGSREWLYWNICLFVFVIDGWHHILHNIYYLKKSYEVDSVNALSMLKEILADFLSSDTYTNLVSCNLIKALSKIRVDESEIRNLLQTTFDIVKRRLPHPPNSKINQDIYKGLEELNRDEIFVALLIARLKTLTTEKTQSIIYSLIYISQTNPVTLIKPYYWVFSNNTFLLPVHRAVLLQILKEYVSFEIIPENLVGLFFSKYPTGYFLEDQYIRYFINYNVELDKQSAKYILHEPSIYDDSIFLFMHIKYATLYKYFKPLTGTYNAYARKRDEISIKCNSYYDNSEELVTPITSLANAAYEIINSQFYAKLERLTTFFGPTYSCQLDFYLQEIVIQVGSLNRRPSWIPKTENFPIFEIRDTTKIFSNDGWIVLASTERELHGNSFEAKQTRKSSLILSAGDKPQSEGDFTADYFFRAGQYFEKEIRHASKDQPICALSIWDTLEHSSIVYVSPFVIRELGLLVDTNLHTGFKALNEEGEIIIEMLTWKESYYGSIDDSTEVPSLDGVALIIRADYYSRVLALYEDECWFVLSQKMIAGSEA